MTSLLHGLTWMEKKGTTEAAGVHGCLYLEAQLLVPSKEK